ncbi:CehA/McbA family metallohydrolase [Desnuesiella massiliensis]|uniref:CehA/McbA family metallohydrolase n=1 Tax=Desnuesiella massiliensis TaxID=1650662 RepID=UPI0006E1BA35|nr:CehA/McbA family metallohydrolase [Desnuesiella massiliensis]
MGKHSKHKSKNENEIKKYRYYCGIPHCHSMYSTGEGNPSDVFKYAKSKGLDFIILTDHSSYLDQNTKYKSKNIIKWESSLKHAEYFNKKNENFLALVGFEADTTWGHMNVINSSNFFKGTVKDIDKLILWSISNSSIICINHPQSNILKLKHTPIINDNICLAEIANGSFDHKYNRYEKLFYKLLDGGWRLGAINGQDNHKMNFGDSENVTIILSLSDKLDRNSLVEALRNRRIYSSDSKTLQLSFAINNTIMGGILKAENKSNLSFNINAKDEKNPIEKIEIITSEGKVVKDMSFPKQEKVRYYFNIKACNKERWYLVKITMLNKKYAYSSPIFLE